MPQEIAEVTLAGSKGKPIGTAENDGGITSVPSARLVIRRDGRNCFIRYLFKTPSRGSNLHPALASEAGTPRSIYTYRRSLFLNWIPTITESFRAINLSRHEVGELGRYDRHVD
jgi:hypothetical protein